MLDDIELVKVDFTKQLPDTTIVAEEISTEDIERIQRDLAKEFLCDSGKPTQLGHGILFAEDEQLF